MGTLGTFLRLWKKRTWKYLYCLITQSYPFAYLLICCPFLLVWKYFIFFLAFLLFYSITTDNLNHRSSKLIVPRAEFLNYLPALTEVQASCWCCSLPSSSSPSVSSLDVPPICPSYCTCVAQRAYPGVVSKAQSHRNRSCVCHTHRVLEHVGADSKADSFKLNLAFQA